MQSRGNAKSQRGQRHPIRLGGGRALPSASAIAHGTGVSFRGEVYRVLEDVGGVAVGEVEELEGDAVLVGCYAEGGEEHVDEADIAGASRFTVILEGCSWDVGGLRGGCGGCCCGCGRGGL